MHDLEPFAVVVLLTALALFAAVLASGVAERLRVPAPAIFLAAAAVAAQLAPSLGAVPIVDDQRIVTVALVLILFDGGAHIGLGRMRTAAAAVVWLGVAGTVVTAGALAGGAHLIFGFDWRTGLLIGAALAPTDPAVVFSVLGKREIVGRAGTLLEGESGANDPVGIALMVSLLGAGGGGWSAVGAGVGQFALQLGIGAAFGAVGGLAVVHLLRRVSLGNDALYPVFAFSVALVLYGGTSALGGSGFLAVFVAGVVAGDAGVPHRREIEAFGSAVASMAEIVAFVVLGLSVDLPSLVHGGRLWTALGIAALLVLVIRPLLVGLVLLPVRLRAGERWFVLLAGLKGAVPILLGTYVLAEGVPRAHEVYAIVFVVVLVTVVVQGGLVPSLAGWLGVPMRPAGDDPQDEPSA